MRRNSRRPQQQSNQLPQTPLRRVLYQSATSINHSITSDQLPHVQDSFDQTIPTYDESINQLHRDAITLQQDEDNTHNNDTDDQATDDQGAQANGKHKLKLLGLNFLNAKQHLAIATCRDCVLIFPLYHSLQCFHKAIHMDHLRSNPKLTNEFIQNLIKPGSSEHFITGIWCLVAAYLSFVVIDGLMVRWIVTYQTLAAILRVLSMSLLLTMIDQFALAISSPYGSYSLHAWILISCFLTCAYIVQNFVTSNLDLKNGNKPRSVDYYNITVYCVVPVGLASFISMIGLLRALLILRVDLDRRDYGLGLIELSKL